MGRSQTLATRAKISASMKEHQLKRVDAIVDATLAGLKYKAAAEALAAEKRATASERQSVAYTAAKPIRKSEASPFWRHLTAPISPAETRIAIWLWFLWFLLYLATWFGWLWRAVS